MRDRDPLIDVIIDRVSGPQLFGEIYPSHQVETAQTGIGGMPSHGSFSSSSTNCQQMLGGRLSPSSGHGLTDRFRQWGSEVDVGI